MIAIYHPVSLERQCNIVRLLSAEWHNRLYEPGEFDIRLPPDAEGQEYLKLHSVISHKGNYGVILGIEAAAEELRIFGRDLKQFCAKAQVAPPYYYMTGEIDPYYGYDRVKGRAETVLKHYARTQLAEPTDPDRKIQKLVVAEDSGAGVEMAWQARWAQLSEELRRIGEFAQMGYKITLDANNKQYVFDTIAGTDRTAGQKERAPVIFCREYKNISEQKYTLDATAGMNIVYAGGSGEEEKQQVTKLYDGEMPAGVYRMEGFTDISSEDIEEVEYGGRAYLKDNKTKESVEAEANDRMEYKKDWFLGDFVTVRLNVLGETLLLDKQITEVQEVFERGETKIIPVFGEKKDNIIKRIARRK